MKASQRTDKITTDPKMAEMSIRFISEVSNKSFAIAYLAIQDCISQKEFCKRLGINESRFSRVLAKLEKNSAPQIPTATA